MGFKKLSKNSPSLIHGISIPVINKDNIKFSFNMLNDYETDEEIMREEECVGNSELVITTPLKAYEEFLLFKLVFNTAIKTTYACKFNGYLCKLFRRLQEYPMNKVFNEQYITKIENKINDLPEIKKLLKRKINQKIKEYGEDCDFSYLDIEYKELNQIDAFFKIILESLSDIEKKANEYIKKIDITTLEMNKTTKKFHDFLNLLRITNKNEVFMADTLLYAKHPSFENVLRKFECYRNRNSLHTICFYTKLDISSILDKNPILSNCLYVISRENEISFPYIINNILKERHKDIVSCISDKVDTKGLTEKDFKHISQLKYLKSILVNAIKKHSKGINILLYGKPGTGKTALASVLINSVTKEGYGVPTSQTFTRFSNAFEMDVSNDKNIRTPYYYTLQNVLTNNKKAIMLFDEAEDFFRNINNKEQSSKSAMNQVLENNVIPTIWTTNSLLPMEESYFRRFSYILNVDELPQDIYLELVNKISIKNNITLPEDTMNIITQYKPSIAIIDKVLNTYNISNINDLSVIKQNLLDTLQGQNYGEKLPKIKNNKFNFNPELINASMDLKSLTDDIIASGRLDFSLLLYGVPGASKTSYARYLAEKLGMKVICKTYQDLASMWVGETEHNIHKLFEEAERDKAFIILDEADVLLQDRTKSIRSWETSQVEAMLTAMEDHPYPFCMTTNLFESLDQAVMRRFLYKVKHDYLTSKQINMAFKHFFDIDINENLGLTKLTPGDFAIIKKQAEYQGKLKDKDWIIENLKQESENKKNKATSKIIL